MRTGLILDWRRTRQQVVQQKFALPVKSRFNPFRDSAGCTIATQWQRKLKSDSSEDQTLLLETRTRHGSHFLRASFAGRRISPPSKTEVLTSSGKKSFDTGATIWRTTGFLELFELLEEYAPVWYTEQHHQRALTACRILLSNPSHALGSERHSASQPCK